MRNTRTAIAAKKKIEQLGKKMNCILIQFYQTLSSNKPKILLFSALFLYGVIFAYLSLVKYYTFHATGWDLGIFSQSLSTTINFNTFFHNNLELGSHFHVHFSPILLLILPFYSAYQSPVTLLVLQAFVAALGVVPLYYLAKHEFKNENYGLAFSLLYLLYPPLHGANLFDFHPEAFAPFFGFTTLYFLKKGKWAKYFVFLTLLLTIKEDIALIAIAIGFYGFFSNIRVLSKKRINKSIIVSLITIIIGIIWLFFSFYIISYFVRLEGYGSLWNHGYSHHTENVYEKLGGSGGVLGVLLSLFNNPLKFLNQLFCLPSEKLIYITALFLPLCAFAFIEAPAIVLFLPTLLEFMLAGNPRYFSIKYHYSFQLAPLILVATLYGVRKIYTECSKVSVKDKIIKQLFYVMFTATFITLLFTTPIVMQYIPLTINEKDEIKLKLISLIPLTSNPHILTQNDYFPHVSSSFYSYAYWNATPVEYILVDVSSYWFDHQDPVPDEYVARFGEPKMPFDRNIEKYIKTGRFGLLAQVGSVLLYKEGYNGSLSIYVPFTMFIDWQKLYFNATLLDDPTSVSKKVLIHRAGEIQEKAFFWYGPYVWIPPGEYEVKFRLKIANLTDKYIVTLDVAEDSGRKILAQGILVGGNFSKINTWQEFTLSFKLDKQISLVEFRGIRVSNATDVYLDYISVKQTAPVSNDEVES